MQWMGALNRLYSSPRHKQLDDPSLWHQSASLWKICYTSHWPAVSTSRSACKSKLEQHNVHNVMLISWCHRTHGTQHYWYQSWITLSPSFDTITSSYQSYTAVCRDDFYAVSPKHQVLFEDTQADKIIHQHAFYQTSQQQPSVDVAFRSGSTSIIYAQQHDYLGKQQGYTWERSQTSCWLSLFQ